MDMKDLEEYRWLKNEVIQINESLNRLLNNQNALVFDTVKGSSHDAPYQERIIVIQGLSQKYAATYTKRKRGLEDRLSRCIDKIAEIDDFIKTVRRSDMRQIIEYRFVQGLKWKTVSKRVYGHASETTALMALKRYLENLQAKG